jgi:hypothetical protein
VSRCDALFDNSRVDDLLLLACISRFIRLFVFFRGVPSLFLLASVGDDDLSRPKLRADLALDVRFDDDPLNVPDLEKSVGSDNRIEASLFEPELPLVTRTDCDLANLSRDLLRLGVSPAKSVLTRVGDRFDPPLMTRTDLDLLVESLSRDAARFLEESSTAKPTEDLPRLTLRDDLALDIRLEGRSATSVISEIALC